MRIFQNKTDKELINMVITLITDHSDFIKNWTELIYNNDLKIPSEIKNRIFTIWFCGTIDTVSQEEQNYLKLLGECKIRDFQNNINLLIQFGNLVESIKIQLRKVEKDKQLGIILFRNTLVHGRIHSVHNKKIKYRVFDSKENRTLRVNYNQKEFWKRIENLWSDGIDSFLEPLRIEFFDKNTYYYNNLKTFSKPNFFQTVKKIGYKDLEQ
uniref:hypothetical protein n=1 Tax=uncultured Polaribacter sp. TaxID=174711 RepID=UPI002622FC67|nr:hypothetical protein [uncultured Polaribacter sp.]